MNDTVIKVENVSKKFCKTLKHSMIYGLSDISKNLIGLSSHSDKLRKDEFWALDDVSFEVKKGETLGIIGLNGSGKSTMLKLLNGIFWPDKGKISIKGRVGALIEVGAGFHPLLTGRENIYVNAAILGMKKNEVDEKIDSIIEFAEIGDFIDAPVKHYSSGMFVRLGFAVAIHCEPDILLVDEILSVGDLSFRNKSLRYMNEFRQKANAVVFVSHNMEQIRVLCNRVLILNKGKVKFFGETYEGCIKYEELTREVRQQVIKVEQSKKKTSEIKNRISSGNEIEFLSMGILDSNNQFINQIGLNDPLTIFCEFKANIFIKSLFFSLGILNEANEPCIWVMSNDNKKVTFENIEQGNYRLIVKIPEHHLIPKIYYPTIAIRNETTGETYERILSNAPFRIVSDGKVMERGIVAVNEKWELINLTNKD